MGNSSSKGKKMKQPKGFFDREKQIEHEREKEGKVKREVSRSSGNRRVPVKSGKAAEAPVPVRPAAAEPTMPYDQEAIERMKNQLKGDANAFLLNNIMLSVQFVENYDTIMWDLKNNSVSESDVMLNDKMAQHHKHVFMPDKLQEAVHAHARFVPPAREGRGRGPPEALQPQRMFVVHDNVEVNEPGEVSDYSTVLDAPFYRMLMEEDDEAGYVRLKKLEILENRLSREESIKTVEKTKSQYSSDSGSESDESGIKGDEEGTTVGRNFMNELKEKIDKPSKPAFKKPSNLKLNDDKFITKEPKSSGKIEASDIISERRPSGILKQTNRAVAQGRLQHTETKPKKVRERPAVTKVSPSGSESSGYKTSYSPQNESSGNESDYGYATITAETTPRRLQKSQTANFSDSTSVIPAICISVIDVKKAPQESDEEDEIDEAYSARYGSEFQRELYKKMYYLNSIRFMRNFSDIFLMKLAQSLGFTSDCLSEALTQGASIYCNVNRGPNKSVSFEILPALSTTWPNAAQGWIVRRRNIIRNPRNQYVYQWPTQYMIGKARGLGCLIVPIGFRPTRGSNSDQSLQWKLTFPAVERYLETCLAHSHVRCYFFTLLMFKSFVKTDISKAGLDYTHIRNHLFWQCEDNYAKWPEDRLGETLRIFLKSFYQHIMKSKMPDYFIPQCNLLKGIPKNILLKQQRSLADVLEAPVMHLLSSLRNLKYMKSNFYPVLDYVKLYNILTCTDNILQMVNPHIQADDDIDSDEDSEEEGKRVEGFWLDIKRSDPRDDRRRDSGYQWRKQQLRQVEAKKAAESLVNNRKVFREPIDRKRTLPSHLDTNRRRLVLELFIPHFISMAECSERLEACRQAIIYLEHANRLSVILKEEAGGAMQGEQYMVVIREKVEILKNKVASPGAPQVPKRNESFSSGSSKPSTSGIKKQKPQQYVNLENVNSAETNGYKVSEPVSPTIKLASIVLADVHPEKERPRFIRAVSFQKVEEEEEEDSDDATDSKL